MPCFVEIVEIREKQTEQRKMNNETAIAKADRYLSMLKAHRLPTQRFDALAMQAIRHNDFRVLEMVYCWSEFECRRLD